MTARLKNLSKGAQVALVAGALLLVAAVGYFAVIGPKRSDASSLKQQTAAVQAQIASNRSSAFTTALPAVRSASVFRLAMAMPTKLQTPDIILQLNALAQNSGISFDRIQPNAASSTAAAVPGAVGDGSVRGRADPGPVHGQLLQPPELPPAGAQSRAGPGRQAVHRRTPLRREPGQLRGRPEGVAANPGDAHRQRVRAAAATDGDAGHSGKHYVHDDHFDDDRHHDHDVERYFSRPEHEWRDLMSRKKRMQNLREAKDRRTKKVALGLSVVLVAVLAFEVPKMLHHGSAGSSPPPATTTTDASASPTAPSTPSTTAPGTVAAAALPTTASLKLSNSDVAPRQSIGQLYSFSHFTGKNPFVQQVSTAAAGTGTTTTPSTGTLSASVSAGSSAGAASTHDPSRTLAASGAARISVNGQVEVVRVGAGFPSSNPLFRLVGASHGSVRIGIANGSYSSGARTVSLTLGRSLTLVDTADGIRYKIRLLAAS